MTRRPVLLVALFALIGFADASYLVAEHFFGTLPSCLVTTGCETVLTSAYATVGPVPLSLVGAGYYLVLFLGALSLLSRPNPRWVWWLVALTAAGFVVSIGLVGIQAFVLRAFCTFCLVSAGTSTLLFTISLLALRTSMATVPRKGISG
jgi:uncharacterized membrane protein